MRRLTGGQNGLHCRIPTAGIAQAIRVRKFTEAVLPLLVALMEPPPNVTHLPLLSQLITHNNAPLRCCHAANPSTAIV